MDNKQDRQFYWKVKDFLNNTPDVKPVTPKPNSLISSVNNILEQNKTYKQNNFNPNLGSANTIRQVIANTTHAEAKGTPGLPVFTKNVYNANPFKMIKEGIFDEVTAKAEAYGKTAEQLKKETGYDTATEEDINLAVEQDAPQPGVPLTDQQRKLRDLQAAMKARRELNVQAEKIKPATPATAGVDTEGPAVPTAEEERAAQAAAQKEKEAPKPTTSSTPVPTPATPTPAPEAEKDEELERLVGGRLKTQGTKRQQEMEQGEENLAYLKAKDTGKMTELQRSRHAQALVRAQRRAEGKAFKGASEEQIRGQEQRGLERKRAASNASMNSVEDIRARAAAERQAANKAKATTSSAGGAGNNVSSLGMSQAQVNAANQTQSGKSGDVSGVGSTPNPQAKAPMPTSSSGSQTAPTTGSSVGPVRSTGAEVSSKAGELMGLGSGSKPAPQTSTSGAAETLGLGSSKPAPEEESAAKKRARETLLK